MQVLALLRVPPTVDRSRMAALVPSEARHIWHMHLAGSLRAVHFLQAPGASHPSGVSLMLEVADLPQAQALISALPMVAEGLATPELLPLAPFAAYGSLFAAGGAAQ